MHAKNNITKKVFGIPVLAFAALAVSLLSGVTVAYLTAGDNAVSNTFTMADVHITVVEDEGGNEDSKVVSLKNSSEVSDEWIRARVLVSSGTANVVWLAADATAPEMANRAANTIYVRLNTGNGTTQWKQAGGYYYYNSIVAPGASTAALVNGVYASKDIEAGTFDIMASGEAALATGSRAASAPQAFNAIS